MRHVEWIQSALDELARFWADADSADRQAITAASHELEQRLQRKAEEEGESRPHGRRVMFVPPLTVAFRIEPNGKTVTVLQVRVYRRRQ